MWHVVSEGLLSSDRGGYVLELLLDQLFRLRMVEVVQIQPQRLVLRVELLFLVLLDLVLGDAILLL